MFSRLMRFVATSDELVEMITRSKGSIVIEEEGNVEGGVLVVHVIRSYHQLLAGAQFVLAWRCHFLQSKIQALSDL